MVVHLGFPITSICIHIHHDHGQEKAIFPNVTRPPHIKIMTLGLIGVSAVPAKLQELTASVMLQGIWQQINNDPGGLTSLALLR